MPISSRIKRALLYGSSAALAGGILWASYVRKPLPDVETVVAGAEIMARVGAIADAEKAVQTALEREPRNLHATLLKGFIAERKNDWNGAADVYLSALRLTSDRDLSRDIELSIADLRRRSGDFEHAVSTIDDVESKCGVSGKTLRLRGVCALDRDEFEHALEFFEKAADAKDVPDDIASLRLSCHLKRNDWDAARREVLNFAATGKDASPLWYRVAGAMASNGDEANAAAALSEFVKTNPKNKGRLKKDPFWGAFATKDEFRALFE